MISKIHLSVMLKLTLACALFMTSTVMTGQSEETNSKKVVIVKKIVDENGNETVEENIYEGEEAEEFLRQQEMEEMLSEEFDLEEFMKEHEIQLENLVEIEKQLQNIQIPEMPEMPEMPEIPEINVDVEVIDALNGDVKVKIIKDGEIIEWNGEGDIPEDIQLKLNEFEFDHIAPDIQHEHAIVMIEEGMEDRPVMGVMIENAPGNNGAIVTKVFEGSGADKAGLQKGDIIYKVDRSKVSDIETLINSLSDKEVGDKVKVRFFRNGKKESEKVELGKKSMAHHTLPAHPEKMRFKECHDMKKAKMMKPRKVKKIVVVRSPDTETMEVITDEVQIGNSEIESLDLNIYPNPASESVNIEFVAPAVPTSIKMITMDGKEIFSEDLENFDGNYSRKIDLNENDGGVILQITQGDKVFTETILK